MIIRWLIAAIFGNLGYVGNGVWRSAQRWYLYPIYSLLGIKTILNVSFSDEWEDKLEKWFCNKFGIDLIAFDNLGPEYNFEDALNVVKECERKPLVIHCQGGRDRTGGLVGVYKREVLKTSLYDIYNDGCIYGVPGECWLLFFQTRL